MLDGDGYVCRFSFAGGNDVHFLSRYVQTRQDVLAIQVVLLSVHLVRHSSAHSIHSLLFPSSMPV